MTVLKTRRSGNINFYRWLGRPAIFRSYTIHFNPILGEKTRITCKTKSNSSTRHIIHEKTIYTMIKSIYRAHHANSSVHHPFLGWWHLVLADKFHWKFIQKVTFLELFFVFSISLVAFQLISFSLSAEVPIWSWPI